MEGHETMPTPARLASCLHDWLRQNRLMKLAQHFEDEEADLNDIKTYSDEMIELRFNI